MYICIYVCVCPDCIFGVALESFFLLHAKSNSQKLNLFFRKSSLVKLLGGITWM